jgi:hypothetical protein
MPQEPLPRVGGRVEELPNYLSMVRAGTLERPLQDGPAAL